MRILVVNWLDRTNPQAGGAEIHLHETFGRLVQGGARVTLLTSGYAGGEDREEVDGMDVHRVGGRHTFVYRALAYYRRHLASRDFDVLVEDLNKVPLFTPGWGGSPVVLLVHHLFGGTVFREASFPLALATWLFERPVPRVYRDLPIVAVSSSTAEDLVARGFPDGTVTVIPNGVDVEQLTPGPEDERFPEPTLLYLGRLKRYKRVDLPIRAVRALNDSGTACRLLVAGRGDDRERLERLTRRLDVAGRVRFLGFVTEEEKLDLLRRSWVHVLTSPKEGWGIATLEAAACGTPTVASDAPGLRDAVRHGETGLLVPHDDVGALTASLRSVLEDPHRREEMGRRARRFAEGFSWQRTARAMERFLEDRVARRAATG